MKNKMFNFKSIFISSVFLFIFSFCFVSAETMTLSFTIDGSSGSVSKVSNYMTFKWESTNTSYCNASASNHYNWSGNKKTSNTEQIFVGWPGTTSYKITCFDENGKTISKSISVTIPSTTSTTNTGTYSSTTSGTFNQNNDQNNTYTTSSNSSCSFSRIRNFKDLVNMSLSCFFTPIVYLIISLSILLFIWGVFRFIKSEGEDRENGKMFMFWGIIGIFVMVSIWGLVAILQNTFKF